MRTAVVLVVVVVVITVWPLGLLAERPPPEEGALFARWLISQGSWGVLNTLDRQNGFPFGNVVSYADGSTGEPFFYLATTLDPTGPNALSNNRSSFTFSEHELGTCGMLDPQFPLCAKITLSGQLHLLLNTSAEGEFAERVLFQKHPRLAGWPKKIGDFAAFKLVVGEVFLVNELKAFKKISVRSYLNATA